MHLNKGKIKSHISNLKESMRDIEKIRNKLDTIEDKDILNMCEEGFRFAFVHIREDIFSACTSLLKASNISVNSLDKNKNIIEMCIIEGYIQNVPREFYMKLTKYRDDSCHKYKVPSIKTLLEFYDKYKIVINQFICDLDTLINPKVNIDYVNSIAMELRNNGIEFNETTMNTILALVPPAIKNTLGKTDEEIAFNYLNVYIKYKLSNK